MNALQRTRASIATGAAGIGLIPTAMMGRRLNAWLGRARASQASPPAIRRSNFAGVRRKCRQSVRDVPVPAGQQAACETLSPHESSIARQLSPP